MAINDISLTAGMRSNLLQLQGTTKLIDRTQERLSTGKQVNSALDNPTNFFAAQAHNNRSADFAVRKDGMSEAIQTVKAADAGISAITSLVQAAKGLASSALSSATTADRVALGNQYSQLQTQITQLANDSVYRGTNLLKTDTMTVLFNENGDSSLDVEGFNATAAGMTLNTVTSGWSDITSIQADASALDTAIGELRSQSKALSNNLNIITNRQNFTDAMMGTLQTGADNLTLADMNQEGANMLMLQTRQNLSTTALSLSSQAAQSVLRLF